MSLRLSFFKDLSRNQRTQTIKYKEKKTTNLFPILNSYWALSLPTTSHSLIYISSDFICIIKVNFKASK